MEFKLSKDRRNELILFIYALKAEGKYPETILDNLEGHLVEGKPSDVVASIIMNEPVSNMIKMMEILFEFSNHEKV